MADVVSSNAPSKTAQKKKAKKDASAVAVASTGPAPVVTGASEDATGDEPKVKGEGPVKDLQRQVRNVTKKLAATQKVDSIVAENPGVSLDDLVSSKKINLDQKAQALKKPSLQAQLAQLEEQINSFRKVEQEYQTQLNKEKERLENAHKVELESLRTTLEEDAKTQAAKLARSHLLTLSIFLNAAAERRALADDNSDETRAFEGLLMLLYGGDATAVDAAEKLVNGSSEEVPPNEGSPTGVSYARVRELAGEGRSGDVDNAPVLDAVDSGVSAVNGTDSASGSAAATDPTVAYEVMTEQDIKPPTAEPEASTGPEQGGIGGDAANAAATDQWDVSAPTTSADTMGESWVAVPRPADETEKDVPAPANPVLDEFGTAAQETSDWADGSANTGAWADDVPPPADDGFHEVQGKHRPRGRGGAPGERRGGGRGGGRGGNRGDFRGRGRGRGGRAGSRGD